MKIILVIPVIDRHEETERVIRQWDEYAEDGFTVLLIDNNSESPYVDVDYGTKKACVKVIRNSENAGMVKSFLQGVEYTTGEVIVYTHNDVLVWRQGWDGTIREFFDKDPKLGLAGGVGGVGVSADGGRIGTYSRFLGREWGSCSCHSEVWQHHGLWAPDEGIPVAILDGCVMIFRRSALEKIEIDTSYPPHHWYDREWSLQFLHAGWHIMVIPFEMDHYSGLTANASSVYHDHAKRWLLSVGRSIPSGGEDSGVYLAGAEKWTNKWGKKLPVVVDKNFKVCWRENHIS